MRTRHLAAAVCAVALVPTACASESDSDGSAGSGAGGTSVSAYLERLPALGGDDPVIVTYGDVARAAEIAGLDRPEDVSDADAVSSYLSELTGLGRDGDAARVAALVPQVSQPGRGSSDPQGFVDDVGWSMVEVDSFAERETLPRPVAVLDGDFDEDQLDGALDDVGDGVWQVGEPGGGLNPDDITPARPIGEALWLSLDDGRLTVARDESDVRASRDADGGEGTLADVTALSSLAQVLDEHDVYSAMLLADDRLLLADPGAVLGERVTPEQIEAAVLNACEGIVGAAVGIADDGAPLFVLSLAHVDDTSAEANLDIVTEAFEDGANLSTGRPWSQVLSVESIEVDGSVLTATARPAADVPPSAWYGLIADRSFPPC